MAMKSVLLLLGISQYALAASSFFFFGNQTNDFFSGVSPNCNTALTAPIPQCPIEVLNLLGSTDYYTIGNDTLMDIFCNASCPAAFNTYRADVASACAKDPQPQPGYPATYWVDAASSVFKQACLKDSKTGQYCTDFFNQTFGNAPDPTAVLGGYPIAKLCSECVVNLFLHQQSTPYSNYDPQMAQAWAAIQKNCGLSYPTATPTLQTNVTSLGNYAPSGYPTASCISGRTYTVVGGDNCEVISARNQVSTGSLIALNSLYQDCSNLLAGQSLCLPQPCNSYIVRSGDTCMSIANSTSTSFQLLVSWNPSIDDYCGNLITGQNICVGPPGGYQGYSTIPGASVTQTAVYATTTAARPSPVASGTTQHCGAYYLAQPGDYCQLIALNQTIDLSLFEAINPQIDSACDNLLKGVYYCVQPTQDWNSTASSTIVTAPTTTPSGTTSSCYQYYTVQKGDGCWKLEQAYGITFSQLQYWNPSLDDSCSNLLLNEAYCVNGALQNVTSSSSTPSAVAKKTRRGRIMPVETADVGSSAGRLTGGVPVGWPGLNSPRLMKARNARDEL